MSTPRQRSELRLVQVAFVAIDKTANPGSPTTLFRPPAPLDNESVGPLGRGGPMSAVTERDSAVETCDVCIVGAGIAGLNALFVASQYLSRDQKVVLIDRRERVGGMWVDTYPYVRLHQPHPMFTAGNIEWTLGQDRSLLGDEGRGARPLRLLPRCDQAAGPGRRVLRLGQSSPTTRPTGSCGSLRIVRVAGVSWSRRSD